MTKSNLGVKFKIDYDQVYELASIMCTQTEIASVLGCSVRTLQRDEKFKEVFESGIESGKTSLRRAQYKTAMNGNVTMLIWLGKQYLDQKEPEKDDTEVLDKLDELLKAQGK